MSESLLNCSITAADRHVDHLPFVQDASRLWHAVYTTARHEKRIAEYFAARSVEYFLPLYRVLARWRDGSRVTLELPLFPNYIFVRISRREHSRVLEVPGVWSIVGFGRELAPVPDGVIESLRFALEHQKLEPHPYLVVGERVRIRTGAMAGMEGVLIRKKNNFRVVVTLNLIMQSVAVEVAANDLEPVASSVRPVTISGTAVKRNRTGV